MDFLAKITRTVVKSKVLIAKINNFRWFIQKVLLAQPSFNTVCTSIVNMSAWLSEREWKYHEFDIFG